MVQELNDEIAYQQWKIQQGYAATTTVEKKNNWTVLLIATGIIAVVVFIVIKKKKKRLFGENIQTLLLTLNLVAGIGSFALAGYIYYRDSKKT